MGRGMELKTSLNKTYEVDWVDVATATSGNLLLQMKDERPLHLIAAEFDGLEWLYRESEEQGNKMFKGFSRLSRIYRKDNTRSVLLALSKGADIGDDVNGN